jgi:hypothetical protein
MSDYFEARYALVVLREARLAAPWSANHLVQGLLRDLNFVTRPSSERSQAMSAIRVLANHLSTERSDSVQAWEGAFKAVTAWTTAIGLPTQTVLESRAAPTHRRTVQTPCGSRRAQPGR